MIASRRLGPLCGSLREFRSRRHPHSGPRRAKRAKRYWHPAKGSARISRAEPLAGWDVCRRRARWRDCSPGTRLRHKRWAVANVFRG